MEIQSKRTTRSAVKRKLCSTASQDGPTSIGKTKNLVGELRGDDIFEPHEVTSPTVQKHASTKPPKEKKTEYSKGPDEVFKNPVCKTATDGQSSISLNVSSASKRRNTQNRKCSLVPVSESKFEEAHQKEFKNVKDETNDRVVQQKPSKVKRASKPKEDNQNEEEKVSCCEKVSPRSTKSRGKKEKVKEESQKPKAKKDKAEGDIKKGISKPELEIPDIIIPKKMEKIARIDGPSPWNGTISYTNKIYLGAHISAAGGLEKAIPNALAIGGNCFALFIKNQRQWVSKPLEEATVGKFKEACKKHNFAPHLILPHGSYLMNCGSSDPEILKKSRATLLEEVRRCERLGILYYNIHPGSSCGKNSQDECMQNIADSINWVHHETQGSQVAIVLENMCRQGNTVGGDFAELAKIISLVADQSRVGVCLDTCHAFAAGYDLASEEGFESFLAEFERHIGFRYLVAVHLNDSEGPLGCHRDRHAFIGKGHIGIEGFRRIINCPRFRDIPIVLETPFVSEEAYAKEINLLKSLAIGDTVCA